MADLNVTGWFAESAGVRKGPYESMEEAYLSMRNWDADKNVNMYPVDLVIYPEIVESGSIVTFAKEAAEWRRVCESYFRMPADPVKHDVKWAEKLFKTLRWAAQ